MKRQQLMTQPQMMLHQRTPLLMTLLSMELLTKRQPTIQPMIQQMKQVTTRLVILPLPTYRTVRADVIDATTEQLLIARMTCVDDVACWLVIISAIAMVVRSFGYDPRFVLIVYKEYINLRNRKSLVFGWSTL